MDAHLYPTEQSLIGWLGSKAASHLHLQIESDCFSSSQLTLKHIPVSNAIVEEVLHVGELLYRNRACTQSDRRKLVTEKLFLAVRFSDDEQIIWKVLKFLHSLVDQVNFAWSSGKILPDVTFQGLPPTTNPRKYSLKGYGVSITWASAGGGKNTTHARKTILGSRIEDDVKWKISSDWGGARFAYLIFFFFKNMYEKIFCLSMVYNVFPHFGKTY